MTLAAHLFDRRWFLSTAAAAAVAMGSTPAFAKVPKVGHPGPSFFRFAIGDIELVMIYDGEARRPLTDSYVRNASLAEVQAAFASSLRSVATTETPFSFLVVNTGDTLVLIDAGSGGAYLPGVTSGADNLAAAGIDLGAVDMVVLTHFHGDHSFGLTIGELKPRFPNAEILVPDIEYRFLTGNDPLPDFKLAPLNAGAAGARQRLVAYGNRVRPYRAGNEVSKGLHAIATPGHSPGHMSFRIASGKDQMLFLADVVTLPHIFVPNPGWHMIFDQDPDTAAVSRRKMLDEAATDRILIAGTHFPFPALARIARRPSGFEYVPEPWRARL